MYFSWKLSGAAAGLALVLWSCFPNQRITPIDPSAIPIAQIVGAPIKVHMRDGSVILFQNGFTRQPNDIITGIGTRYSLTRSHAHGSNWTFPIDSVLGLEYYDEYVPGGRVAGSLMLAASVGPGLLAVFGSCPTVYTSDGTTQHLEAECFSRSIGSRYERSDLDRLEQRPPESGRFTVRVKNEALETHYIDRFRLGYVDHPVGTNVFPDEDGEILSIRSPRPIIAARDRRGADLSTAIRYQDNISHAVDTASIRRMMQSGERDWLDLTLAVPRDAESITLALRGRNTLESTILLYEVMMRDQGLAVLEWSETLNSSLWYAWKLSRWYNGNSGIDVSVEHDGEFEDVARITDAGPIAWKPAAVRVPLGDHGDTVRIRLAMQPDSWSIDWVGFDLSTEEPLELKELAPSSILDHEGKSRAGMIASIDEDDGDYLVTYPGEWLDLSFDLPVKAGMQRTLFVLSKGYYVEWVRPEWVRARPDLRGFDPSEPEAIRRRLADLWIARKESFEKDFIEHRIPTAEPERAW